MFGLQSRPPENSLYKAPKQSKPKPGCLVSVLIVFVLLSWAVRSPHDRLSVSVPPRYEEVTTENYHKLNSDMTYDDVCLLFGGPESMIITSTINDYVVESYLWYASDGISNCTVVFNDDGYLSSASSIGLDDGHISSVLYLG